jgi:phage tail protein X
MKSLRFTLAVVLLSLSALAFAQSDPMSDMKSNAAPAATSDAQKSFEKIKTLSGVWEGHVTTIPPLADMGDGAVTQVSMRVTSRGNALVHEMKDAANPDDPAKYDHPVTMFYVDSDRLLLTHYCDAGNRPRMSARTSPDGKTIEFDFLDVAGSTQYGHMQHAVFTIIDANHHIEEWTYLMPGDKPIRARIDLQRTK